MHICIPDLKFRLLIEIHILANRRLLASTKLAPHYECFRTLFAVQHADMYTIKLVGQNRLVYEMMNSARVQNLEVMPRPKG